GELHEAPVGVRRPAVERGEQQPADDDADGGEHGEAGDGDRLAVDAERHVGGPADGGEGGRGHRGDGGGTGGGPQDGTPGAGIGGGVGEDGGERDGGHGRFLSVEG